MRAAASDEWGERTRKAARVCSVRLCRVCGMRVTRGAACLVCGSAARRGDDRATPLHVAVMVQDQDLVRLLLNSGALIKASDADGRTPQRDASPVGKQSGLV